MRIDRRPHTPTQCIKRLNDAFRKSLQGGKVMLTSGVKALPKGIVAQAYSRLRSYDDFTPDNDPFGEHEFGSFELAGRKFFWKIEPFDTQMRYASKDPSDPKKTIRVLTLMLANHN